MCEVLDLPAAARLDDVWARGGAECRINDEIYGPKSCAVMFASGGKTASIEISEDGAHADVTVAEMFQVDAIPGGHRELVVVFKTPHGKSMGICRDEPTLSCTEPIQVAGDDWSTRVKFAGGQLVLDAEKGPPPPGTF